MFISKALVFATSQSPVPIRGKWSGIKTNVFIVQVNPMNKGWERNNFFYRERMNFPLSFLLHLIVVIHRYWMSVFVYFNTLTLIHTWFSYLVYLRLALFAYKVFLKIRSNHRSLHFGKAAQTTTTDGERDRQIQGLLD